MNKHLICLGFAVIAVLAGVVSAGTYSGGGNGTAEKPYRISTPADMNNIGNHIEDFNKCFVLVNDIDLSGYTGTQFNIIGYHRGMYDDKAFTGVFDGNGHTISNFTYETADTDGVGLFGYIDDPNALIKDLTLVAPDVNAAGDSSSVGCIAGSLRDGTVSGCGIEGGSVMGYSNTGGLVGGNSGTISNCHAAGSVSGDGNTGGLVGSNDGRISNCYAAVSVSGDEDTGGLTGWNGIFGTISNCYATGVVEANDMTGGLVGVNHSTILNCYATGSVSGTNNTGGLAGYNDGTISNCYAAGSVSGEHWFTGGLVGYNDDTISNCYATGSVSGYEYTGGLVGGNSDRISNCYATGSVIGDRFTGGLAGYNHHRSIENCYAVGSVTGTDDTGGLVGYNEGIVNASFWDVNTTGQSSSGGGEGKTTEQMQTMSTFFGWGCTPPVWTIDEGRDYLHLAWEEKPGEPLAPTLADFLEGAGTQERPYLISTAEELNVIGLFIYEFDKYFKVTADIDMSVYTGTQFNIIGDSTTGFSGVFDGAGHTISNFTYTTDAGRIGLFGYVDGANAVIKDLTLTDPNIEVPSAWGTGSLVGWLGSGMITGCSIEGGSVTGAGYTGGLVGDNGGGTISNCYREGSVRGTYYTGGLVGYNWGGTISNCYAEGSVTGTNYTGGLVGHNGINGTILNCYAASSVTGNKCAGGLVGKNWEGMISNCYAAGSVTGTDNTGGLVGYNEGICIVNVSFWDIETGGPDNGIGTGLPTSQMQTMSTFTDAGWDFVTPIWTIDDGNDYPRLWWEECPEPVEAELWIFPRVIVRHSGQKNILVWIRLPEGVDKEQISDEPIQLWPGEIEAVNQYVIEHGPAAHKRTSVLAFFNKAELMDAVVDNGEVEVEAVGSLKSGRYFYGSDTVLIKARRYRPSRRWW